MKLLMKKNIRKIFIIINILVLVVIYFVYPFSYVVGTTYTNNIDDSFPKEYKAYLTNLHNKYPNWKFTAKHVGLNWNDVITAELGTDSKGTPRSLIGNTGRVATREELEYSMNPLNFLNEAQIFQFENMEYNSNQTKMGVSNILYGTDMSKDANNTINVVYYNKDTKTYQDFNDQNNLTYSDAIFNAGKSNGVNPYNLAARIRIETMCDIKGRIFESSDGDSNSLSICGRYNELYKQYIDPNPPGDYTGYYNFYNIGATGAHPVANALLYAKTPGNYGEPWNDPIKAIYGGAKFIKTEYVDRGQDTLYFEKFNVVDKNGNYYTNQYMQNIKAPESEASIMYNEFIKGNSSFLNVAHEFIIPVYNDVPGSTLKPGFVADDTIMKVDAGDCTNVNVRADARN